MRKVFLSSIILSKLDKEKPVEYISEELKLSQVSRTFFISHIIDSNIQKDDEVVIITGIPGKTDGDAGEVTNKLAKDNYELLKEEIVSILKEHNIAEDKVRFVEVVGDSNFSTGACNRYFKKIANELQEEDSLYVDITFGMKPYTFSMFIATAYAVRAAKNINMELVAYAERYNGTDVENINKSIGYDLTNLFYLNEIAGNVTKGNKASTDRVLDVLISE